MKNKKEIIGCEVSIKPAGERFYIDYMGFYFTKEQAQSRLNDCPLWQFIVRCRDYKQQRSKKWQMQKYL